MLKKTLFKSKELVQFFPFCPWLLPSPTSNARCDVYNQKQSYLHIFHVACHEVVVFTEDKKAWTSSLVGNDEECFIIIAKSSRQRKYIILSLQLDHTVHAKVWLTFPMSNFENIFCSCSAWCNPDKNDITCKRFYYTNLTLTEVDRETKLVSNCRSFLLVYCFYTFHPF